MVCVYNEVGIVLSLIRAEMKESREVMAEKIGMSMEYLCKLEFGKSPLTRKSLERILSAYGDTPKRLHEISNAYDKSAGLLSIDLLGIDENTQDMLFSIKDNINDLNEQQVNSVLRIINNEH